MKYPWTKEKYCKVLKYYNLTPVDAARMLGVTERSGQYWAFEKNGPPFMACLIFHLMKRYDLSPQDVNKLAQQWHLRE